MGTTAESQRLTIRASAREVYDRQLLKRPIGPGNGGFQAALLTTLAR
jgi:hypothetical protein